jgi:Phage integrase family
MTGVPRPLSHQVGPGDRRPAPCFGSAPGRPGWPHNAPGTAWEPCGAEDGASGPRGWADAGARQGSARTREAAFAVRMAKATDYVFASETGTPLHYRNVVRRGLDKAAEDAGLIVSAKERKQAKGDGLDVVPMRFHDLRDTFASLLIAQGSNVVFVSRQLGHSSPNVTLGVYAHLFDQAEHGQRTKDAMEAAFWKPQAATSGKRAVRLRR